jgi:fermentation-respiration switch protein FrsA (DUF1100 family)
MMKALGNKVVLSAVLLAALLSLLLAVALRNGYEALLLLADLAHLELPLPDNRPGHTQRELRWQDGTKEYRADLYLPNGGPRAGLVLVPGAAKDGFRDPRLVEFAVALVRSSFVVLVPDIRSLRELRLEPENARDISAAVAVLRRENHLGPGQSIGVGAFSVAAGPAVLAALDPDYGSQISFLLLVGGYYDLERTLAYFTTGWFRSDDQLLYREPDAYGKWVYLLGNAAQMESTADREALVMMARRKLDSPLAPVDDLLPALGPEARAVYDFVENTEHSRATALMRRLPGVVRQDIQDLNLANYDLARISARFILVHGVDDNIIPYSESIALADALPPGQASLYLLKGLKHVDRDFESLDAWRMWRALRELLAQRD